MARRASNEVSQTGKKLSEAQIEAIHQLYAMTGNKAEVARLMKLGERTVHKYLKKMPEKEVAERRASVQRQLAGKVHLKANEIIDSITPEDMQKASLVQKTTAAAILIDKEKVIMEAERALTQAEGTNNLMMPNTIAGLVDGITGTIKRLGIIDIQFENKNPDLAEQVAAKLVAAEDVTEQAEVLTMDGLDGHESTEADPDSPRSSLEHDDVSGA
jgi:hypothetical protein